MGVSAGALATAAAMPGERIATRTIVADTESAPGTTETEVLSLVAPLVAGRTYRVRFIGHINSTVGTDDIFARIHVDDVNGQELQSDRIDINASGTAVGRKCIMEVEWVPTTTGPQTFVITVVRSVGTGNGFIEASSTRPAYFVVDYVGT